VGRALLAAALFGVVCGALAFGVYLATTMGHGALNR
jgi:hypothetical protein